MRSTLCGIDVLIWQEREVFQKCMGQVGDGFQEQSDKESVHGTYFRLGI